jgi:D-3-phosphoglycerate dehydrogenase
LTNSPAHDDLRIVVPDDAPAAVAGSEQEGKLQALGGLQTYDSLAAEPSTLLDRIRDADVAICVRNSSQFSEEVLSQCTRLKHIAVFGIGVDMVDLEACKRLGITVTNIPGYSAPAVAEAALTLALSVSRKVRQNDLLIRGGDWARAPVGQLYGKTLGIIGAGPIGKRMAELGLAVGMNVIGWTFHPDQEWANRLGVTWASLEDVLSIADVVSIHLRLSDQSRGLVDATKLGLMKPTSILVNTARGAIVDEDALVGALESGRIAGAGLDVFTTEPLPPGHAFTRMDNVVLSPHVAASTPETDYAGLEMVVDNIRNWLEGNPTNVVA